MTRYQPAAMTPVALRVLVIGDDTRAVCRVRELLEADAGSGFDLTVVDSIARALEHECHEPVDIVLLDLALSGGRGLEALAELRARAPTLPIVAVTALADESLGETAVEAGAADCVTLDETDPPRLGRSIRYAALRARSRHEFQDFIDAMTTLSGKIAIDGTLLVVNRTAQQASGLPLDVLMKANFLEAPWWSFDPDVQARVREAFHRATEGALIGYEERVFAFGKVATIHLTLAPVKRADGTVDYIVAEGRDITRRLEVEEALKATNEELEAFTYSVSHDLRAPIRQIDGFSRLLAEQIEPVLDAKARHYLARIRESTQHMGRLVDDLLRLSQVARQDMRPRLAALDPVLQEVLDAAQSDVGTRAIEWKIAPLPTVECDPGLMRVVFSNLIANAVKYTRPRHPAVIEVGQTTRGGRAVIFVRDNGVGFDMRYVDRLFGVFQRLHRPEEFEGTGVGLATVQRIVHKHGGEIWAESEPDGGTTFSFTLGQTLGSATATS